MSTISPDRELRKSLQELGENSAYTAKGLFKMADTLAILYASCLCTSFTLSVIVLAFPKSLVVQPASAVALILTLVLLSLTKAHEKTAGYRELANSVLKIHNEAKDAYRTDPSRYRALLASYERAKKSTDQLPIWWVAYWWARRCITRELRIEWTTEELQDAPGPPSGRGETILHVNAAPDATEEPLS